ncbi:MAG TPA: trehalase family glycosidase [Terriglobia bacterium]|nr:trehalase family glycosidase [Terriglobia bacterium]
MAVALALMIGPSRLEAQKKSAISQLFAQHQVKQAVIKPPTGLLKHPYVVPSGPYFQLFDWDMYFMGVALSYDGVGQPVADSVKDFLEFVDANANNEGYTPREIAPGGLWALPEMCKPVLAQAALRASETMGTTDWLLPYYTKLTHTLNFWENTRRSPDGLFRWFNGVESGVDNNPAVSDVPAGITEGVDLQCYVYREYLAMALLAEGLGNSGDAARYREKAETLKRLVQQKMWSGGDGMFLNIDSRTGQFVRVKTWTNFVPLWAGIAMREHAQRMVQEHILNPKEFWAAHGLRTLAADEPLYNPNSGYWRGPIWVISNYLVMHGLMNYGFDAPARELAQKTVDLLVADLKTTGGMNENYGPDTGTPLAGGKFVSWDLLAEHMAEEAKADTDPAALELPKAKPAGGAEGPAQNR